MDVFEGGHGHKRRADAIRRLRERIVACRSQVVRRLGGDRGGELSAHRVPGSCHVTPGETLERVARRDKAKARRQQAFSAKESARRQDTASHARERLDASTEVIMVGERENDIYEVFAGRAGAD